MNWPRIQYVILTKWACDLDNDIHPSKLLVILNIAYYRTRL